MIEAFNRNMTFDQFTIENLAGDLLPDPCEPFDLIVCNIISQELIRLAERFPGVLTPGGRFIGSGFLITSLPAVEDALARNGLENVEAPGEEGWTACVAMRPAPAG